MFVATNSGKQTQRLLPSPSDLSKSGRCGAGASPLTLTERIINRFSQVGLLAAWDVRAGVVHWELAFGHN